MLGVAAVVYFVWWFGVEWLLPGAFNPLGSRLAVVGYFLACFAIGLVREPLQRHAEVAFNVGAVLLVGHYFYLFHHNARDINWGVGAYVVVFTLCVIVESRRWLYLFVAFSLACGLTVWWLEPVLRETIFLPGLVTILSLCLMVLRSRSKLLDTLTESTTRFQSLFDATFEGVAVQERDKIIDVNAAFVALFGYSREQLVGRSVLELCTPEGREIVASQIQRGREVRYESIGLHRDGTSFAIEISTKPHVYQGRTLRLSAVRDISDRKKAEQERLTRIEEQAAHAAAQEALRLRDEFISIASHELRTPITSILLHLDAFDRKDPVDRTPENFERYATRARRQLNRMRRLVEALLDVSRIESGQLSLDKEPVELEVIVKDVLDTLSEDLRRAECTVEVHHEARLEGCWDRMRLEQVLGNLLRNAMIYGAGKPIDVRLEAGANGRARLSIRDRGIGIEKAVQERVFLRFERAVSTKHYGGLGLGLYIARQIIEAHDGTVGVESELGQGAMFWIELPTDVVPKDQTDALPAH